MTRALTGPITVVGAGRVDSALGGNLLERGHGVRFAVRDGAGARLPARASAVPVDGAASGSALVLLAVPFSPVAEVVPRGFDAVDVGGLEAASVLEEAARYWGLMAFAGGRGRQVVLVAHERS